MQDRGPRPRRSGLRRIGHGWRFALIIVVALGVLAADGLWLVHTRPAPRPQTPRAAAEQAVSRAAALTSARASFTTQVAGVTTVFGRVSEQLRPQRAALTMTLVDGSDRFDATEVVTDSAVYLRAPGLANSVGKPWISVSLPGLTADRALTGLYQTEAIPTMDAALVGTATVVRSTGPRTVEGVRATRYVGTIEPAVALQRLSPSVRHLLDPELTEITGVISFVVWIDQHHNFVKLQTSATMFGLPTVTTVVVTAFNQRIHLAVPDPDLVSAMAVSNMRTTGPG